MWRQELWLRNDRSHGSICRFGWHQGIDNRCRLSKWRKSVGQHRGFGLALERERGVSKLRRRTSSLAQILQSQREKHASEPVEPRFGNGFRMRFCLINVFVRV